MVAINQKLINQFNELAINNRIDPYFDADIELFFEDKNQFSLNIKRSRENVALYSSKHVEIRQRFFNSCKNESLAKYCVLTKPASMMANRLSYESRS